MGCLLVLDKLLKNMHSKLLQKQWNQDPFFSTMFLVCCDKNVSYHSDYKDLLRDFQQQRRTDILCCTLQRNCEQVFCSLWWLTWFGTLKQVPMSCNTHNWVPRLGVQRTNSSLLFLMLQPAEGGTVPLICMRRRLACTQTQVERWSGKVDQKICIQIEQSIVGQIKNPQGEKKIKCSILNVRNLVAVQQKFFQLEQVSEHPEFNAGQLISPKIQFLQHLQVSKSFRFKCGDFVQMQVQSHQWWHPFECFFIHEGNLVLVKLNLCTLSQMAEGCSRNRGDGITVQTDNQSFSRNVTWYLGKLPTGSPEFLRGWKVFIYAGTQIIGEDQ